MHNWHILGAGAIGCLFAANLQRAGIDCCLVLRGDTPAGCSIDIEGETGPFSIPVAASAAADASRIDRLLVTTKAYDVEGALASVSHRLGPASQVLVMVNGMGLLEIAASQLPGASLFAGTTTEGAYCTGPRQVRHAGRGITRVGSPRTREQAGWFHAWQDMPLGCSWDPDIEAALWHKLAINCAINPLTALHQVRNGELQADPRLRAEVTDLCAEIAAVSEAAGFRETARLIARDAVDVILSTADNKSSMLQDCLAGRPTEIEFITGYLVSRADALGVAANRNRELLERIRDLGV